jgi:hypothetical protein
MKNNNPHVCGKLIRTEAKLLLFVYSVNVTKSITLVGGLAKPCLA